MPKLVQPIQPTRPGQEGCPSCEHLWQYHSAVGCFCRCMQEQPPRLKTRAMERIERQYGINLVTLLASDYSNYQLAEMLDMHFTTISTWRKRLGLQRKGGDIDD